MCLGKFVTQDVFHGHKTSESALVGDENDARSKRSINGTVRTNGNQHSPHTSEKLHDNFQRHFWSYSQGYLCHRVVSPQSPF